MVQIHHKSQCLKFKLEPEFEIAASHDLKKVSYTVKFLPAIQRMLCLATQKTEACVIWGHIVPILFTSAYVPCHNTKAI